MTNSYDQIDPIHQKTAKVAMTEFWADLLGTCAAVGWKIAVENPLAVNLSELGAQNRFLKLANEWFSDPLSLSAKVAEAVELAGESGTAVRKKTGRTL